MRPSSIILSISIAFLMVGCQSCAKNEGITLVWEYDVIDGVEPVLAITGDNVFMGAIRDYIVLIIILGKRYGEKICQAW